MVLVSQNSMLDPFSIWKTMYENTEANLSEAIHETLQKESFAEWLRHLQSGFLQYQHLVQSTTDNYLKQMNMPTREEVSSVATLIINVEEKVEALDEKIEDELFNDSVSSEINKLKSSVAKLDKKMDLILQGLEQINKPAATASAG